MNNEEPIMMDFDDCVNFIIESTKLDKDTVTAVLDAETEFMRKIGIIIDKCAEIPVLQVQGDSAMVLTMILQCSLYFSVQDSTGSWLKASQTYGFVWRTPAG